MKPSKVKIELDERALKKVVADGIKRNGLDLACPACGERFTMHSNPARCPRCGREIRLR